MALTRAELEDIIYHNIYPTAGQLHTDLCHLNARSINSPSGIIEIKRYKPSIGNTIFYLEESIKYLKRLDRLIED